MQVIDSMPYKKRTSLNDGNSIDIRGDPRGKFCCVIKSLRDKYEAKVRVLNGAVENLKVELDQRNKIIHEWEERYKVSDTENQTKLRQIKDLEQKLSTSRKTFKKCGESTQTKIQDLEIMVTLLQDECKKWKEEYMALSSESRAEVDSCKTKLKSILANFRHEKEKNVVTPRDLESQVAPTKEYLRKFNSRTPNEANLHNQENGNRSFMQFQSSTERSVQKSETAHISKDLQKTLLQKVKEKCQHLQMSTERILQEKEQMKKENDSLKLSALKRDQQITEIRKLTSCLSRLAQDELLDQS